MASDTGSTANPYHYVGALGYQSDRLGLQQLGYRFYWPELGRFIQQDPITAINRYAYANNNPVTGVDPSGLITSSDIVQGISDIGHGLGQMAKDAWHSVTDAFTPSDEAVQNYVKSRQIRRNGH